MPGLNRTGPHGMGPMTGGGRGLCHPGGIRSAYQGRGFGFGGASPAWPYVGRGRGGLPRCWYPGASERGAASAMPRLAFYHPSREEELGLLRSQAEAMKGHLSDIECRIQELEKEE